MIPVFYIQCLFIPFILADYSHPTGLVRRTLKWHPILSNSREYQCAGQALAWNDIQEAKTTEACYALGGQCCSMDPRGKISPRRIVILKSQEKASFKLTEFCQYCFPQVEYVV